MPWAAVMSLSVHSIASEVLDTIFRVIPQEEVRPLRMELYGKEFSLFASDDKDVTSLQGLIERRPDRKEQLLKALHDTIGRLITKGLYTLPFVQVNRSILGCNFCNTIWGNT